MQLTPSKEKCLIVGCGDIGTRLVRQLSPVAYQFVGIRRNGKSLAGPIELRQCDATNEVQITTLLEQCFDIVVVTLTPGQYNDSGYREAYVEAMKVLTTALERLQSPPRLVLFVSSTSVYGQNDGSWIDEDSQTQPRGYAGRRLLEAEQLLLSSSLTASVIRFSGIYGPGRCRLIQQVRDGRGCASQPPAYTNRIHADDCAGVLAHLIESQRGGKALAPVYLATDCEPVPMWDIKQWLAARLGYSREHLREEAVNRSSKRCSNRRLLESGYRFRYPTYREGYGALLKELQVR